MTFINVGPVNNPVLDFYGCPELLASDTPSGVCDRVRDLRFERYPAATQHRFALSSDAVNRAYYAIRPYLSDRARRTLQRAFLRDWNRLTFPHWPLDTSVEQVLEIALRESMRGRGWDKAPFIWFWPDGANAAGMITHDVETTVGLDSVSRLIDVDDSFGIKSSFQLVPEKRYQLTPGVLAGIRKRQCEVNVHCFNHDGNLFRDRATFSARVAKINKYVQDFGAEGFRSGSMYRNADWLSELAISYDMSVPNVAHLEPQRGGCCTVFPYFIGNILELPLTTIQDYSLFHILGDYSIELWREQIELIMQKHGLISFIVHPDYVFEPRALTVYRSLLTHISHLASERNIWMARPGDVNRWWRERDAMKLVLERGMWRIQGAGRERARIGIACIRQDRILFTATSGYEVPCEVGESGSELSSVIDR